MRAAIPLFALLHLVGSCEHCGGHPSEPDSGLVDSGVPDGRLDPEWVRLTGSWYFPSPQSEAYRRRYEELLPDAEASGDSFFRRSELELNRGGGRTSSRSRATHSSYASQRSSSRESVTSSSRKILTTW